MAKKSRRGQKQCPKCSAWIKGTRAKECPKCGYQFNGRQPAQEAAAVAVETPAKAGHTITIEQVRAVAEMARSMGGFSRLNQLLGLVKEIGGLKKFKDLLEAMSVTEVDDIPF